MKKNNTPLEDHGQVFVLPCYGSDSATPRPRESCDEMPRLVHSKTVGRKSSGTQRAKCRPCWRQLLQQQLVKWSKYTDTGIATSLEAILRPRIEWTGSPGNLSRLAGENSYSDHLPGPLAFHTSWACSHLHNSKYTRTKNRSAAALNETRKIDVVPVQQAQKKLPKEPRF